MRKLATVIALATLLTPAIASAELSYDAAQLSFERLSQSGKRDLNMTNFNLTKGISSNVFLEGEYQTGKQATGTSFGDVSAKGWILGAGYHTPITTNTDFIVTGRYRKITSSAAGTSLTGDSRILGIGIRSEFTPQFEGGLSASYASSTVGSSSSTTSMTGVKFQLGFKVMPQFQLMAGLASNQSGSAPAVNTVDIGIRFFY
ncbi:MAG: hypothetical protein ABL911_00290 [Gallionella sp.]